MAFGVGTNSKLYTGWYRLNDVMIQGSLFEISPSTTLKPGSTALGTGVGIYYFLPQMLYIDLIQRLDISTCQVQQLFGMVMLPVLWLFSDWSFNLRLASILRLVAWLRQPRYIQSLLQGPFFNITNRLLVLKPSLMLSLRIPQFLSELHTPAMDRSLVLL